MYIRTSFFYIDVSRQQLESVYFKENWMEKEIVGCGSRRRIFLQAECYEILQNAPYSTSWQSENMPQTALAI